MPTDEPMASPSRSSGPPAPAWGGEAASDAVLLGRFVDQWDQEAFRDLVRRHGPMVLGVCRRVLRDPHAAEDAFQATFLLLVRRAGAVRKRESVGPWLYGVARRVALEARGVAARRVPVCPAPEAPSVDDRDGPERDERHAALHEELGRLPEKYRAPLVLCYIEGLTHEAASQRLGWPLGTVRVRIARGRDLLGARLTRRGLTPAAVLLALALLPKTAAAVPPRLVEATVRAAARVAAGERVPRGDVPARVIELERRVRNAMRLTGLKWATLLALAALAAVAGAASLVPRSLAADDDAAKAGAERKKLEGTWTIAALERDGDKQEAKGDEEEIRIEGESFGIWHNGHVEEKGTIKLDPSKDPRQIDFQFQEGRRAGKTDLAIYAWDGSKLKVCWVKDGDERPADFATKPGDRRVLLILKRQDP